MPEPIAYRYSDWIGYLYRSDVDLLIRLARELPDNPIVINIGAGIGTSGLCFMEARPDLILYSIDVNDFPNPYGGLVNERTAMRDNGFLEQSRFHQILGDSAQVGKDWTGGLIDMVFVDGEHTWDQVTADVQNWLPHVKQGGIMAFHDYHSPFFPGIPDAARQFIPDAWAVGDSEQIRAFKVQR